MRKNVLRLLSVVAVLAGLAALPACQTDEPGVKTNYYSQWTNVNASTEDATQAAEEVLSDLKLVDVKSNATAVDGSAVGQTADGTKITVETKRVTDDTSQVSVYVGTTGDPELGKQIVRRIQEKVGTTP